MSKLTIRSLRFKSFLVYIFFLLKSGIFLLSGCGQTEEATYNHYCGSCHLIPAVNSLPRDVWMNSVLPNMGTRMGVKIEGDDRISNRRSDLQYAVESRFYPEEQLIPMGHWEKILAYVSENAPKELLYPVYGDLETIEFFNPIPIILDTTNAAFTTSVFIKDDQLNIGTINGAYYEYVIRSNSAAKHKGSNNAISQVFQIVGETFILDMGNIHPNDQAIGSLSKADESGVFIPILRGLQRPVFMLYEDLDNDGQQEIVVCEYGNYTGQLSIFKYTDQKWVKEVLLNLPGTLKVMVQDMNFDGQKDLVVLTAQAREGLWILTQTSPLNFSSEQVITLPAAFGSSGFDMIDLNQDGLQDVAIVNGDNADLSMVTKPYHGLTLFQNMGKNQFKEISFTAIPGATNVVSSDFDQDGTTDFVVSSFFDDQEMAPGHSLVYLTAEQGNYDHLNIYKLPLSDKGKWLVLSKGDYDRDGDDDFAVGSFLFSAGRSPVNLLEIFGYDSPDVMLYENTSVN